MKRAGSVLALPRVAYIATKNVGRYAASAVLAFASAALNLAEGMRAIRDRFLLDDDFLYRKW